MTVSKMMFFFCIAGGIMLALIPHVIWLTAWIISKIGHFRLPYRRFGLAALTLAMLFWGAMAYGYFIGRWHFQTTQIEYAHKDIPKEFDGFRIAHISDLHLGTFDDNPHKLEMVVKEINSQDPDIVCFTGDMVTIGKEEAEPYKDILKAINARHGVLSVFGNHDFLIYGFPYGDDRQEAEEALAGFQKDTLGWTLLRNENITIEANDSSRITFIGVDNTNCSSQGFKTISRGDLKKAMEGTGGFRILLSHDPSHWTSEVVPDTDIQLTLSGHTHAAQVRIFGWTPATVSFDETDGRYDRDGQTLYINIGLGCTVPFRLGARPEITVITLKSQ